MTTYKDFSDIFAPLITTADKATLTRFGVTGPSGYKDLNEIFEKYRSNGGPVSMDTRHYISTTSNEIDFNQIFAPYVSGIKASATGYKCKDFITTTGSVTYTIYEKVTLLLNTRNYECSYALFFNPGSTGTFKINEDITANILVVGGGGSGSVGVGSGAGSGGGGGGICEQSNYTFNSGVSYDISVAASGVEIVVLGNAGGGNSSIIKTNDSAALNMISYGGMSGKAGQGGAGGGCNIVTGGGGGGGGGGYGMNSNNRALCLSLKQQILDKLTLFYSALDGNISNGYDYNTEIDPNSRVYEIYRNSVSFENIFEVNTVSPFFSEVDSIYNLKFAINSAIDLDWGEYAGNIYLVETIVLINNLIENIYYRAGGGGQNSNGTRLGGNGAIYNTTYSYGGGGGNSYSSYNNYKILNDTYTLRLGGGGAGGGINTFSGSAGAGIGGSSVTHSLGDSAITGITGYVGNFGGGGGGNATAYNNTPSKGAGGTVVLLFKKNF